jgi:hypothetical protein
MGERIEDVRTRLDEAEEIAKRADSIRVDSLRSANQVELDTAWVGPLRVAHLPTQKALAEEVFGEVWSAFDPLLADAHRVLSPHLFVFRYAWRLEGMYLQGPEIHKVEMSRRFGRARLLEKARNAVARAITYALPQDSVVRKWMGNQALTSPADLEWVYRDLASTPAMAARRCYRGDLQSCWAAMGLPPGEGGWKKWYSQEERWMMVRSRYGYRLDLPRSRPDKIDLLTHGCVNLRSDRACLLLLERPWDVYQGPPRIPLGPQTRASLLTLAIVEGGEGSFTRFLAEPDAPLRDRMASAAGLPPDTLMARWRMHVLDARPAVHAGLLLSPFSLALWILALLALASRSTRWRFGR